MSWISHFLSRNARIFHFALILVMSVALIIDYEKVNDNISTALVAGFYYPFDRLDKGLEYLGGIAAENDSLKQEIAAIKQLVWVLENAKIENKRLRDSIGFEPPTEHTLVPAEIIKLTRTVGAVPTAAEINRGARHLVLTDMPIINQNGLVGHVIDVKELTATVQLLTDPANRVAARISRSRYMGIVRYHAVQGLILDNFPLEGNVQPGDTVVSSGLGGRYPEGLLVGTVKEVTAPKGSPYKEVKLESAVNFHTLEEVFVLREGPP